MISGSTQSAYDTALREIEYMVGDMIRDSQVWFDRLSDVERLVGLCGFILALFFLVLTKAATRSADPHSGRSFVGSFTLVVVFSFLTGYAIDGGLDLEAFIPRRFL